MAAKDVRFATDARDRILRGVEILKDLDAILIPGGFGALT